jgi:copper chaperone
MDIKGMTCNGCVVAVRNVLSRQTGVAIVQVDVGSAKLEVDDLASREPLLRDAISRAGFEVTAVRSS